MRDVIKISVAEVIPDQNDSLVFQGISSSVEPSRRIVELYDCARDLFVACAQPAGIVADITQLDFAAVFYGEGRNEPDAPVAAICARASCLALFAATLGQEVHARISALFERGDFALASMLDSVASAGVEIAADVVEKYYTRALRERGLTAENDAVMRYSPGYCGWHVSGQKKLFNYLKPGEIGIELRESFLMDPLKSVSGVLMSGPREIHLFDDTCSFCGQCEDHSCRKRIEDMIRVANERERGPSSRPECSDRKG
ncbi:hypothetical protein IBX73_02615 [candidate division WOR-3 bacterium]|nr:hypothetical protein [candidate division WOR-3 bacterium]